MLRKGDAIGLLLLLLALSGWGKRASSSSSSSSSTPRAPARNPYDMSPEEQAERLPL